MTTRDIIEKYGYKEILDQDGWETLELTVRAENSPALAAAILAEFQPLSNNERGER